MMNKYIKVIQKYHQYESKDKTKVWLYAKPLCTNSMHSNVLKLTQCQRVILVSAKEPLYQHCRGLHSSKHSPSHEQPSFRFRAKPLLQLHVQPPGLLEQWWAQQACSKPHSSASTRAEKTDLTDVTHHGLGFFNFS